MLDHMTFRVTDIQRAKAFYSAALAPLGYCVSFEGHYGMNILGFAYPDPAEPDGKTLPVPAQRPIKPIYVKKFLELIDGA